MRTRAECEGSAGGSTNVVSLRLNSVASCCICWSVSPEASGNTARGLPPKRCDVKTSTVSNWKVAMGSSAGQAQCFAASFLSDVMARMVAAQPTARSNFTIVSLVSLCFVFASQ